MLGETTACGTGGETTGRAVGAGGAGTGGFGVCAGGVTGLMVCENLDAVVERGLWKRGSIGSIESYNQ
jgi:hypothetical protein